MANPSTAGEERRTHRELSHPINGYSCLTLHFSGVSEAGWVECNDNRPAKPMFHQRCTPMSASKPAQSPAAALYTTVDH